MTDSSSFRNIILYANVAFPADVSGESDLRFSQLQV